MSQETIIFSMERVSKTVPPQKTILKNIYLSFFYGAKIGVLGLNGAGKSSLMRCVAGILPPSQGRIEVYGSVSTLLALGVGFNPSMSKET